jgi:Ca-activated chloride channel family protein
MSAPGKLELLEPALKLLVNRLTARDRVAIVTYAGRSGVLLEPTAGDQKARILAALDGLAAGGSTNGGAGIRQAYALARQSFIDDGINRVILATDGDFNVGTVNFQQLKDLVEGERKSGVALTTLGFGAGNYNDQLMEQLADAGNGNHAYIDNLNEARKVLVGQMTGTLQTIAKDVKIQVEFNPAAVSEYRLIGYENRALKREDFSNDKVDAGEIGAGHTVTALYEISLAGDEQRIAALRYGSTAQGGGNASELAFVRIRYKKPGGDTSQLIEWPLRRDLVKNDLASTDADFRFAAAVAAFGQILRGGKYTEGYNYQQVERLARGARGTDPFGYRGGFLNLVALAEALDVPGHAAVN